LLGWLWVD